jgi:hypothetical protein
MTLAPRIAAIAILWGAAPLVAQAPRITPAGDPSVRSDSIYALVVDSAQYPDQPYVVLLDDGVITFEADGRSTTTYRQVVQILTQEGAEVWGDQSFSYSAGRERLTVNWLKVLRRDGSVISDKPAHQQEMQSDDGPESAAYSDDQVTLPEGWQARLPAAVSARSAFGEYQAEYSQNGRELRVTRRIAGWLGTQPPDRIDDLIAWMRAVAKDDARFLVLDKTR